MPTIPLLRRFTAPWSHFQPQTKVSLKRFHTHLQGDGKQDAPVWRNAKKALIIGIGYDGKGSDPHKLPNARRDAKLWKKLLKREHASIVLISPLSCVLYRQVRLQQAAYRDDAR